MAGKVDALILGLDGQRSRDAVLQLKQFGRIKINAHDSSALTRGSCFASASKE